MELSYSIVLLYPFIFTGYLSGLALESICHLPTTITKYNEKKKNYLNSPYIYVDFNTYTKYTGFRINHNEYKDYIYIVKNNKLIKAHLMVNKNTHKIAYVVDDISVCDNVNNYKLNK